MFGRPGQLKQGYKQIQSDQNKTKPKLKQNILKYYNELCLTKIMSCNIVNFYSVTKLKKTNISHFLTLYFRNFPP
jgi:hypothetical protein